MRLEPTGNPIGEKAGEVLGLLSGWTADAIGGRNLIKGTTQEPTIHKLSTTSHYKDIGEDVPLEVGQTYTFSVIIDKVSDDTHPIQVHLGTGNGRRFSRDILDARNNDISFGKRFSLTFTPNEQELEGEDRTHFAWRIRNQQRETTVSHRELKLERGPVATPWTPAPDDVAQNLLEGETLTSPFPQHNPAHNIRTDTSVGTRVFVGDTMIYGDTGWRDVSGLLETAPDSGKVVLRRDTSGVWLFFEQVRYSVKPPTTQLLRVPEGFRPRSTVSFAATGSNMWDVWNSGPLYAWSMPLNSDLRVSIRFPTSDPWPTSLPGTPA